MDKGLQWSILTHEHRERSVDWYWALGLIILAAIALCVYLGNVLFALILALGGVSIAVLSARGPREHEVYLHPRGVTVDGTLYPYQSIHSFWVWVDEPPVTDEGEYAWEPQVRLLLSTDGYLHPRLTLPLENLDHGQEVRDYLAQYLTEEETKPRFSEVVAELLGF